MIESSHSIVVSFPETFQRCEFRLIQRRMSGAQMDPGKGKDVFGSFAA
jgi:hypothetical protein